MNFEITELASKLNLNNTFKRIGLQFAYELQNAFQIEFITSIKLLCAAKEFFIIGDTSYGSCCCDEITAKHLNADVIVRIGSSCFTRNESIPVYFLYENKNVSKEQIAQCCQSLNAIITEENSQLKHIIIFCSEKEKKYLIDIIRKEAIYEGVTFADIGDYTDKTSNGKEDLYGRDTKGFIFDNEAVMIYIGADNDLLLNELCLRFITKVKSVYLIDTINCKHSKINQSVNNTCLFRRYNLIEKAKQSNSFGILIGSLSIRNLNQIILCIKNTLQAHNKKCYTFLLGKLTEEKLCNFSEYIDCFVLIACPFNSAYHMKTGLKPIVSSLDIKIAFDSDFKWGSSYSFDVNFIQPPHNTINTSLDLELSIEQKASFALENKSANEALIPIFSQQTLTSYDERKFKGLKVEGDKSIKPLAKGKRGIPIKYEDIK